MSKVKFLDIISITYKGENYQACVLSNGKPAFDTDGTEGVMVSPINWGSKNPPIIFVSLEDAEKGQMKCATLTAI